MSDLHKTLELLQSRGLIINTVYDIDRVPYYQL